VATTKANGEMADLFPGEEGFGEGEGLRELVVFVW
jgi:hypothetical protein